MIKLKKQKKHATPKKTSIFIYKHLDTEFRHDCKTTFNLRYNRIEGHVEFRPTDPMTSVDWSIAHGMDTLLQSTISFVANVLIFRMFKINGFKMEVHSTYEPDLYTTPYAFGHITYGLRYYTCNDSFFTRHFGVLKDPRSMIVTTKQPFHSQEIIFPRQFVITKEAQGFGRWLSTDFNTTLHEIEASLHIGTQYQGYWTEHIHLGQLTVTFDVSFKDFRNS